MKITRRQLKRLILEQVSKKPSDPAALDEIMSETLKIEGISIELDIQGNKLTVGGIMGTRRGDVDLTINPDLIEGIKQEVLKTSESGLQTSEVDPGARRYYVERMGSLMLDAIINEIDTAYKRKLGYTVT